MLKHTKTQNIFIKKYSMIVQFVFHIYAHVFVCVLHSHNAKLWPVCEYHLFVMGSSLQLQNSDVVG